MGRIRTIKPEMFTHSDLYDAERETGLPIRFAWAGLLTVADREGRFKWKPRDLKAAVLPHDELDFAKVLEALDALKMIMRYTVDGQEYGYIPTWKSHQTINNRESQSVLPPPPNVAVTREARVSDASEDADTGEGKGKEGKGREGESTRPDKLPDEDPLFDSNMVAQAVMTECGLGRMPVRMAIEQVARFELTKGADGEELARTMSERWREYDTAKPRLEWTCGPEKFFGDGLWKSSDGWPWRQGQKPKGNVLAMSALDQIRAQRGEAHAG